MDNVTLALALMLGIGFTAAKLAQCFRLPSVTGFILAGLALGPSGLGIISKSVMDARLGHFTQIALMLIAFGVGEHLEFKKLRNKVKSVGLIGLFEGGAAFLFVSMGTFGFLYLGRSILSEWSLLELAAAAMLLGSVSAATAPASTLHVVRDARAAGPLTTTLMQVVAINNGMAIMFFGIFLSLAVHIIGAEKGLSLTPLFGLFGASLVEITASLVLGIITGLLIDFSVNRLRHRHEMLTAGLALLLVCGEIARLFHLSPLLAGMATGCTIVNRDFRDVRLFRVLNAFEPPIYVLFFTLAGAHLDISSLGTASGVGITYFLFRALGKCSGAYLGAYLGSAPLVVRKNIGFALLPQADVAIGLIFLAQGIAGFEKMASFVTTAVLAGVFLSELLGPIGTRLVLEKAGEVCRDSARRTSPIAQGRDVCPLPHSDAEMRLIPWTWEKLCPAPTTCGSIVYGVSHEKTVAGLTRMAAIFACHYRAIPVALRVLPMAPAARREDMLSGTRHLFSIAADEACTLGYPLETTTVHSDDIAEGILKAVDNLTKPWGIILGHPMTEAPQEFQRVVEVVADRAPCPVIVVRFTGILHTERILVPLWDMEELEALRDLISALSGVGKHQVSLFYLLPPETTDSEMEEAREKLAAKAVEMGIPTTVRSVVNAAEARAEAIVQEAQFHDIVIMEAGQPHGLRRFFFGSLAERVALECGRTTIVVRSARASKTKRA